MDLVADVRPRSRKSSLTKDAAVQRLKRGGWERDEFAYFAGIHYSTLNGYLRSTNPKPLPVLVELALEYIDKVDKSLLFSPSDEQSLREGGCRTSNLSKDDLVRRLGALGWSTTDFGRLCGVGSSTVGGWVRGINPIPRLVEIALSYVEHSPDELLTRPEVLTPIKQSRAKRKALWKLLPRDEFGRVSPEAYQ